MSSLRVVGHTYFSTRPKSLPIGSHRAVVGPGVPVTRTPQYTELDTISDVGASYQPDYQLVTLQRLQPARVPKPVLTGYAGRMMITYDNASDPLGVDKCRR